MMRYEFDDGMVVDYSGDIHITKSDTIDLYIEEAYIPANVRNELEDAASRNSRDGMRKIAVLLTDTVGARGCLADVDSKACVNF
jgi:hypothetical protein